MIITVRQFDPSTDTAIVHYRDEKTVISTGNIEITSSLPESEFRDKFIPDGIWLACNGDTAIGAILFGKYREENTIYTAIHGITVEESCRRHGIGGTLMYKAEIYAKNKGIDRMILHTRPDNEGALTLFKKCWYSVSDSSDDSLTMKKILRNKR